MNWRGITLALLLFNMPQTVAAFQPLVIGVISQDPEAYQELVKHLSSDAGEAYPDATSEAGEEHLQVTFKRVEDFHTLREQLDGDQLQGAILSSYRYVMLTAHHPRVRVVARLRRGGAKVIPLTRDNKDNAPGKASKGHRICDSADLQPQDGYQGVLIARINESRWPPLASDGEDIRLGVRGAQSTSSFLFPAEFMWRTLKAAAPDREGDLKVLQVNGWQPLVVNNVLDINSWASLPADVSGSGPAQFDVARIDLATSLDDTTRRHLGVAIKDYRLVNELSQENPRIDFAGISSHWLESYSGERSFFRVVRKLPDSPIPYDPVILHDSVDPDTAEELQRLLLATQTVKRRKRDEIFPIWAYPVPRPAGTTSPDMSDKQVICRRHPDIHSFMPAKDTDYDIVRRTAVSLAGGIEVKLALSNRAHWLWGRDEKYFEKLKSLLINPDSTFDAAADNQFRHPIFLDYRLYDQDFTQLADALDQGTYELAELNASEAGRLAYDKSASLMGHAMYRDGRIRHGSQQGEREFRNEREYRMVLLYRHSGEDIGVADFVSKLEKSCVAVARGDVSSVQRYAMYYFDKVRRTPIPEDRLKLVDGIYGVARALKAFDPSPANLQNPETDVADCTTSEGGAQFGLLAEFEYLNLEKELGEVSQLQAIPLADFPIPNAVLMFSRRYAPYDEDLQPDRAFSRYVLRALVEADFEVIDEDVGEFRRDALHKIRQAIKYSRDSHIRLEGDNTGFLGVVPADKSGSIKLAEVHSVSAKNYISFAAAAMLIIVLATALAVWLSYRRQDGDQFLLERLQLGGDDRIQNYIHRAIEVRHWLLEKQTDNRVSKIYGGAQAMQELADGLDKRIVTLLAYYRSESTTIGYAEFLEALSALVRAVQDTMKPVEEYEQQHDVGPRPEDARDGAADYGEVFNKTMSVTLELAKAFTGKG